MLASLPPELVEMTSYLTSLKKFSNGVNAVTLKPL
jgi:hypothetical protein